MFRGFYNLTSEMISQNRNMNVISNNMVNVSTPGHKSDTFVASTFREELVLRSGSQSKINEAVIGKTNMIKTAQETVTDFAQGALEETNGQLDVALTGKGFFEIQTTNGTVYTRNGSFMTDNEGYLALSGIGRVMGTSGPLKLGTDNINIDSSGNIYSGDGLTSLGKLSVVDFANYNQLIKEDNGVFSTAQPGTRINSQMQWKYLEKSNVDATQEMTDMMSGQRSLQSSAQVLKMYDQLMGKIVSEIGRL